MTIGPVEYVLIAFPGNQFKGEIIPALRDLVESGTVRIIDLVFVGKAADGAVTTYEYGVLAEAEGFADVQGEAGGVLGEDDIARAAEQLEPNSSAALIVWEDTWAAPLAGAIRNAGGLIVAGERIPHELVTAVLAELEASA